MSGKPKVRFPLFRFIFLLGVVASTSVLVLAAAGFWEPSIKAALSVPNLLLYDGAAVIQMILLGAVAANLPPDEKARSINWLYTAGFLHTLMALGITIVSLGLHSSGGGAETLDIGEIITPMGAAVIPHAIGVFAGQMVQPAIGADPEDALIRSIAQDAVNAQAALGDLYSMRESVLRAEITAIKAQIDLWVDSQARLRKSAMETEATVGRFLGVVEAGSESASKAFGSLNGKLQAMSESAEQVEATTGRIDGHLRDAAENAEQLQLAFNGAKSVMHDLNGLQKSIVELLSNDLFRK